jgi:hypothetical protein
MAVYPAAIPTIPDDGTWNHSQVGAEITAVATELGTNPRGSQSTVAARFTTVEGRVTAVEGATGTAGVEVGSATLTSAYSIYSQTSSTTWTDIGLSIAVPAQTRAYTLIFSASVAVTLTSSAWTAPKYGAFLLRIVDSGVTVEAVSNQFPVALTVNGAANYFFPAYLMMRVAAGQGATTWKVQAKEFNLHGDAQVSQIAVNARAALGTPGTGVSASPAVLLATTI